MLLLHGATYISRRAKTRRKGRGKRSGARIGRRRKNSSQKNELRNEHKKPPAKWISPEAVPKGWAVLQHDVLLKLYQISSQEIPDVSPIVVSRSLVVKEDRSWVLYVNGHQVIPGNVSSFSDVPSLLDPSAVNTLLHKISSLKTCVGNYDARLIHLATQKKNYKFLSSKREVIAYLDSGVCVSHDGQQYPCTIRRSDCQLLSNEIRCDTCHSYRKTLLCMSLRLERSNGKVHKKVNHQ